MFCNSTIMKKIIILTFLFFTSVVFSQQEESNWYFGENSGIKFHPNGSVTALLDGQLNTKEGCATISDGSGNLLFYTDGSTIWNKNHQLINFIFFFFDKYGKKKYNKLKNKVN